MLIRAILMLILLPYAALAFADSLATQPIPINIPSVQKPKPKPALVVETEKPVETTQDESDFNYVSIDMFFQSLEFCGADTAVKSAVVDGKIYGEKNNVCHFKLTPKQMKLTMECYLPMDVLLTIFTETPSTEDGEPSTIDSLGNDENQAIEQSTAARNFYSNASKIMLYCETTGTDAKVDDYKSTFEGNVNATN